MGRLGKRHVPDFTVIAAPGFKANPMVDMMGALASIGLDAKQIPDRAATFNRFAGAQGRLRPLPAKGGKTS